MKAIESSLKGIIEGEPHRLEVPFFQRKYVWKEENWQELLEALSNFKEEKVFWGSIIIKKISEMNLTDTYSRGYIIDGQQRLTTIALLTKAIYDTLTDDENGKKRAERVIENYIFFPPVSSALFEKGEYELIIEHSRVDKEEFETIMKAGLCGEKTLDIEYREDMPGGQIQKCYAYFRKKLMGISNEELLQMNNSLYGDEKVFVYNLLDENDINEQVIFDSINRAGQKLFSSDIIKNNLFKKMMDLKMEANEVEKLCDKYWDGIFWTNNEEENIWDQQRQFGNIRKSHLDFLLYCVACIEWTEVEVKKINERLEQVYMEQTANYSMDEMRKLVKKIAVLALIYKKYIMDFGKDIEEECFSNEDVVKRLLLVMDKFKIQMFYPYVLKLLYDKVNKCDVMKQEMECDIDDVELKEKCFTLETYLMRRRICGVGTSTYSKECSQILKRDVKTLIASMSDEEIEEEDKKILQQIKCLKQSEVPKMVLFCIELTKWNENDDIGQLQYGYQLEHIMPQKWEEHWSLKAEENTFENKEKRKNAIYEIGNMLLLSQKLNGQIQNREFVVKVEGEEKIGKGGRKSKREGYRARTQLKLTKEIIDKYDAGDKVWDEEHIQKRTEKIGKDILKHWNARQIKYS